MESSIAAVAVARTNQDAVVSVYAFCFEWRARGLNLCSCAICRSPLASSHSTSQASASTIKTASGRRKNTISSALQTCVSATTNIWQ